MTSDSLANHSFSSINQYFDGKRSDDEILYCADISRRQLREVLHHYDDYVRLTSVCYDKYSPDIH